MADQPHMSLIIPYRDRESHLKTLLPHLATYFSRDVLASRIPLDITIVEQAPGGPFNRGLLLNIGFLLTRDRAQYACFHDVDYLPIWADYSFPEQPCSIVWHGFVKRPLSPDPKPGATHLELNIDIEACYGAVQLISKEHMEKVNGFGTEYWGYGFEDDDLRRRCKAIGLEFGRRKGTFQGIVHATHGFKADGQPTQAFLNCQAVFRNRWLHETFDNKMASEGLSTTRFTVVRRDPVRLTPAPERPIAIEKVLVEVPLPPA